MLYSETWFWLVQTAATHKGNDDVTLVFTKAKKVRARFLQPRI